MRMQLEMNCLNCDVPGDRIDWDGHGACFTFPKPWRFGTSQFGQRLQLSLEIVSYILQHTPPPETSRSVPAILGTSFSSIRCSSLADFDQEQVGCQEKFLRLLGQRIAVADRHSPPNRVFLVASQLTAGFKKAYHDFTPPPSGMAIQIPKWLAN